jgi:hypothetical protein
MSRNNTDDDEHADGNIKILRADWSEIEIAESLKLRRAVIGQNPSVCFFGTTALSLRIGLQHKTEQRQNRNRGRYLGESNKSYCIMLPLQGW